MFNGMMDLPMVEDPGDPKPKKKVPPLPVGMMPPPKPEYDWGTEMRTLGKKNLQFDNLPATEVIKRVSQKSGIPANFLYSSAYIEGMNKAISQPDNVSEAYINAKVDGNYPVDGFYNYGVDTFGSAFPDLVKKGYLPQEFADRFKAYPAKNEAEMVNTAAFRTNEDALMAKAAMMRDRMETVRAKAKAKGVDLDDDGLQYLTLASYNGKTKSSDTLFNEYIGAKDKKAFIEKGQTSMKGIHKNIYPRLSTRGVADELLK